MNTARILAIATILAATVPSPAQRHSVAPQAASPDEQDASHRTRLYLKDGTYQVVLSWKIKGKLIIYRSAERSGETEEIPLDLVDLDKTKSYAQIQDPQANPGPILDPELSREEREREEQVPEVAPNLHLPERESVLALDTFRDQPELIPLTQTDGALNRQTAHNILRQTINPFAHAHQLVQIKGTKAQAQMHVDNPAFFIRVDADEDRSAEAPSGAFQVDTGQASVKPERVSAKSRYVIVRCDVRNDVRIVSTFEMDLVGSGAMQEDVVETKQTLLPGGHWLKLEPKQPLLFGEYALIEIINEKELNLGVWDFGVHPTAPENRDSILPQERRRPTLGPRRPHD